MTDIVERLRETADHEWIGHQTMAVLREAADEIERLQTVLRNIADFNVGTRVKPGETPDAANLRAIRDVAREAV
jgi:hypothetical protein